VTDDRFVVRVMWMTAACAVFGAWFLLSLGRVWQAASFAVGAGLSLAMLGSSIVIVRRGLAPGMPRSKWVAGVVAVAKYAAAGAIVWRFVEWPHARMGAFVAGVALTQIVLVLKAIGKSMAPDREPFHWDQAIKNLTRMR
jgi:hypothetical protein